MFETLKRTYALLTPRQRRQYNLLLIVFSAAALLQVASVASLAPYIALLANPQVLDQQPAVRFVYDFFGFSSYTSFLVVGAIVIVMLIAVSNLSAATVIWLTCRFTYTLGAEIQQAIVRSYLARDYVAFSRINSAYVISLVTQEAPRFIYMVIQPTLLLISQALVALVLLIVLLLADPLLALISLLVVSGGYLLVYQIARNRLKRHGDILTETASGRLKLLSEGFGGIKEVKLLGLEGLYDERIDQVARRGLRSQAMITVFGDVPKFMLETIAFSALLGLAVWLLLRATSPATIVALLSLYAMAGYKLLPAGQTIFKAFSSIRANQSALDSIRGDVVAGRDIRFLESPKTPTEHMHGDIELLDVRFTYPGSGIATLRGLSARIPRNRITAIVGASGAGKSTLLDVIMGLLAPTSGIMKVGAIEMSTDALKTWRQSIGYVPQNIYLLDDTVEENIRFGSVAKVGGEGVRLAARLAQVEEVIDALPGNYACTLGERGSLLSGGQRQRIGIARALFRQPSVLIMDEATSALDSMTERGVMNTVANLRDDMTVILVAHRASTIRYADHAIVMRSGEIVGSGMIDDLLRRSEEFRTLMAQGESAPESPGVA